MFCPKCGNHVENGAKYCSRCGNSLSVNPSLEQNNEINSSNQYSPHIIPNVNQNGDTIGKINNNKMVFIGVGSGVGLLVVIVLMIALFGVGGKSNYYFSSSGNYNSENDTASIEKKEENNNKKGKYQTVIITDNTYNNVKVSNESDAYKLIEKDSVSQKNQCPAEIKKVEDEIIEKYNITAVNLCEMDVEFARELENVFEVIYRDYPNARGHITNLTLMNTNMLSEGGIIAEFMPVFPFATSDTDSSYPWVIKTQILLSSQYFLNKVKLEASTKEGSSLGHFPPNETKYNDKLEAVSYKRTDENVELIYSLNRNHILIITIKSKGTPITKKLLDSIKIKSILNYSNYTKNEIDNGYRTFELQKYIGYEKNKVNNIIIKLPENYKEIDERNR